MTERWLQEAMSPAARAILALATPPSQVHYWLQDHSPLAIRPFQASPSSLSRSPGPCRRRPSHPHPPATLNSTQCLLPPLLTRFCQPRPLPPTPPFKRFHRMVARPLPAIPPLPATRHSPAFPRLPATRHSPPFQQRLLPSTRHRPPSLTQLPATQQLTVSTPLPLTAPRTPAAQTLLPATRHLAAFPKTTILPWCCPRQSPLRLAPAP